MRRSFCQRTSKVPYGTSNLRRLKRYDKINTAPYAKRTARRVAGTPAPQSDRVGRASRTSQAGACRHLEYLYLAVARTKAGRRFRQALGGNRSTPHVNLLPEPIAMFHRIHTHTELRQQIHDDLRIQHPEWVEPNGESSMCLMEELDTLTRLSTNQLSSSWSQCTSHAGDFKEP